MASRAARVLVTRSPQQSSSLAECLRALGLEPILIPAIEITEPTSFRALDAALAQLDDFHWLLFTSANAVEAFHRRVQGTLDQGAPFIAQPYRAMGGEAQAPRIAAIGASTARALEAVGLTPDLIPPQAVAESLAESLLPHVRQPDGSPTRFLLIRAEEAREHLPATLRSTGAFVTIAPAYRNIIPTDSIPAIRALVSAPDHYPDAITFTSSSTVSNLLALCEAAGVTLPSEPLRISIGPITSQTLRDAGYPPHAEAPEPTVTSLAETVVKTLGALQKP
jgi:uroporphyrinogen-III synthase